MAASTLDQPDRLQALSTVPIPRTPLVGRVAEVSRARSLLRDEAVPLLTLTGPGGVGKTRLALAIAHDVANAFADGAVWVDLAPIRDPALVLPAVARAFGVGEAGTRSLEATLAAHVKPRQVLVLLDNCEQVLEAAPGVGDLLAACPALQVLTTSRAPLRLHGEHLLAIGPLAVPAPSGSLDRLPPLAVLSATESVALFVARARAFDRSFALDGRNAAAVAAICRRLDGLPLAIELAAAWLRALSVPDLRSLLTARLRVLTGGERDRPDRHRTLRDTIAWSYDLLSPDERALFCRLAVFADGFDAEAAAAVGGSDPLAMLERLTALSDQSLVRRLGEPAGATRWALLETIREFGLELLAASGEEGATRDRHLAWSLAVAEAVSPPDTAEDYWRLDAERDNLRAALEWAIARGASDAALRLAGGLAGYWWTRGDFTEGRAWLARALALPGGAPALRVAALSGAAGLTWYQGEFLAARELAEQSLTLALAHGDAVDELEARLRVGQIAMYAFGDAAGAMAAAEDALVLARRVGDSGSLGWVINLLGSAVGALGDAPRAATLHEEAIQIFAAGGHRGGELYATLCRAFALRDLGRYDEAAHHCRRGAELARCDGNPSAFVEAAVILAVLTVDRGDPMEGARLMGLVDALNEPLGLASDPVFGAKRERAAASGLGLLGLGATLYAPRVDVPIGQAGTAVVVDFYAAVNRVLETGDPAPLADAVAHGYVAHGLLPDRAADLTALQDYLVALHLVYPRLRLEVEVLVAAPEAVMARVALVGAKQGMLAGIPISGPAGLWGTADGFRVAGDRIAEQWSSGGAAADLQPLFVSTLPLRVEPGTVVRVNPLRSPLAGATDGAGAQARLVFLDAGALSVSVPDPDPAAGGVASPPAIVRGGSTSSERQIQPVAPGPATTLHAGDLLIVPAGMDYELRPVAGEAVIGLSIWLLSPTGIYVPAGSPGGLVFPAQAPDPAAGDPAAPSAGPPRLAAGRVILGPGAGVTVGEVPGMALLTVESGILAVTAERGEIQDRVDSQPLDGHLEAGLPPILLPTGETAVLSGRDDTAAGEAALLRPGGAVTVRNLGDAPASFLLVTTANAADPSSGDVPTPVPA